VAIPRETPSTTPEEEPTEAIPEELELHVPGPAASVSVVDCPKHTWGDAGIIAGGEGLTENVLDTEQMPPVV